MGFILFLYRFLGDNDHGYELIKQYNQIIR